MKKILPLLLILSQPLFGQTMSVTLLPENIKSSFRALSVIDDSVAWVSGTNGTIGRTTDGGKTWSFTKVKGFEKCDFRSLYAFDRKNAVIANAGSPAYILITGNAGKTWKTVYTNNDSLAFFDGIDFWNSKEGVIYGDPIGGHLMLMSTINGGKKWTQYPEESSPLMDDGEASFAASGTGIRCYDRGKILITTGGMKTRLLISGNSGKSWDSVTLPATHGAPSRGIFSVAFSNDTTGIIVGGDYTLDSYMVDHVFFTCDGGKGWIPSNTLTGGFRECVEFIDTLTAIAAGPGGFDITFDGGREWSTFSEEKGFHVIRKARKGNLIIAAGNNKTAVIK